MAGESDSTREAAQILNQSLAGDLNAQAEIFEQLWSEIRNVARRIMQGERNEHTWQASDLANECLLRMLQSDRRFQSEREFIAAIPRVMRHLLIDYSRRRGAQKRGGDIRRCQLEECHAALSYSKLGMLDLEQGMEELAELSPRQAQVIEMRFFAAMSWREIAALLEISESMVRKESKHALAFLRRRLGEDHEA